MSKKKPDLEIQPVVESQSKIPAFKPDTKTYAPAWNETFKRYDLLVVSIESADESVQIVREVTRFTHDYQIHAEIIKRLNDDFMKKGTKR